MSPQGPVVGEQALGGARLAVSDCPDEPLAMQLTLTQPSVRLDRREIQALRELLAQAETRLRTREIQALLKRNHELPL
jgi:hypothetical protein